MRCCSIDSTIAGDDNCIPSRWLSLFRRFFVCSEALHQFPVHLFLLAAFQELLSTGSGSNSSGPIAIAIVLRSPFHIQPRLALQPGSVNIPTLETNWSWLNPVRRNQNDIIITLALMMITERLRQGFETEPIFPVRGDESNPGCRLNVLSRARSNAMGSHFPPDCSMSHPIKWIVNDTSIPRLSYSLFSSALSTSAPDSVPDSAPASASFSAVLFIYLSIHCTFILFHLLMLWWIRRFKVAV